MSEDKKLEFQAKRWSDNKDRALSNKWYAITRMDLMVIAISGAGIYIGFELIKFLMTEKIIVNYGLVKASSFVFTLSIITNFISQLFGYLSNESEAKFSNLKLLKILGEESNIESKLEDSDSDGKKYNRRVNWLNVISATFMLLGIVLLVGFIFKLI